MRYFLPAAALIALLLTVHAVAQDEAPEPAPLFQGGGNTWAASKTGDSAVYRTADGGTVSYELTAISDSAELEIVVVYRDASGAETDRSSTTANAETAPMPAHPSPPAGGEGEWTTDEYVIADRKLACQVLSWTEETAAGEKWFSPEVPCGGAVLIAVNGNELAWLIRFTRDGETVEMREEVEEAPAKPEPVRGYGEPITLTLPESIRREMRDQGTAITRLRLYFEENDQERRGAALEFEGMYTEVPVIYAAFDPERCDKVLSFGDWLARDGRYVDLGFDVKTRPRQIKGLSVQIEHRHLKGEAETLITTYEIAPPEPGQPWDSLRLQGALPGINRYALVVSYTDAEGRTSKQRGFSHWVIVNTPPMFEFENRTTATATRTETADATLLNAEVMIRGHFELHRGLDPADCTLRVSRRGKREAALERLPLEVRRVVAKDAAAPGWQEVGRCDLADGMILGRRVVTVEDERIQIELGHGFAVSSKLLPAIDEWEYRFELIHRPSRATLAAWLTEVSTEIAGPQDIPNAKLRVTGTRLQEPIQTPFEPTP